MRLVCVALCLVGLGIAWWTTAFGSTTPPSPPTAIDEAAIFDAETPESDAGPVVPVSLVRNVVEQPYAVSGATANELRASLNRRGPYDSVSGRRVDGLTVWDLSWSFRYEDDGDSCRLAGATVRIDIVINLPDLSTPDALNDATFARWDAYLGALREHEMGHADRQLDGAEHLQTLFERAPPAPSCRELGNALAGQGEQQIAAGRRADVTYDAETGHGRTQGAVFP